MKASVTCEKCHYRQSLARQVLAGEVFYVVCHNCEEILYVEIPNNFSSTTNKIPNSFHDLLG